MIVRIFNKETFFETNFILNFYLKIFMKMTQKIKKRRQSIYSRLATTKPSPNGTAAD
jgi:hypothetical protein